MWPDIVVENGAVAQKLLKRHESEDDEFDVIVVGSGMGGGVVASSLADENKKVLVLEAGSMLFPTHVGNLPRRILIGKFQKHIWSVWNDWKVENYKNQPKSEYKGGQAFNLGGRSLFWGASIPELAPWELNAFPEEIQQYLLQKDCESDTQSTGYKLASKTFNADVPELKAFHAKATETIGTALGAEWEVKPAPVAVEYSGATEWSVPCGIFSTSDLLLEDAMVGPHDIEGRYPLCVNLNHMVWDINFDGDKATGVNCFDLLERKQKTYRAKAVVLAAGTLESAKIALQSKIPNPLIGKGITDHPIYYRHFTIPPTSDGLSRLGGEPQSTKLIIRHKSATLQDHAFDVIVELGAQYNQGRFTDNDHLQDEIARRQGHMLCEIVFQFYAPLMEDNSICLAGWNQPVSVCMRRYDLPDCLLTEARQLAGTIFQTLHADKVLEEDSLYDSNGLPILYQADLGGVAHEVGTLRMPVDGIHGVVDENLKFEGYRNLFACDNSVFPCSPAGNPSLTLVALARRCAKEVARVVHQQNTHVEEVCVTPVVIPSGPIRPCAPPVESIEGLTVEETVDVDATVTSAESIILTSQETTTVVVSETSSTDATSIITTSEHISSQQVASFSAADKIGPVVTAVALEETTLDA